MANIFIVHGAFGSPYDNWQPWLYEKLTAAGHKVFVPHFPSPEAQSLQVWSEILEQYDMFWDEETIVVAHSIGCAFAVDEVIASKQKIKGAVLVSPFYSLLDNAEFDEINEDFFCWEQETLREFSNYCFHTHAFHGDNDPYVPLALAQEFCQNIGAALAVVSQGGHLNAAAGYGEFPALLQAVKDIVDA